jgi:hypothetical protein
MLAKNENACRNGKGNLNTRDSSFGSFWQIYNYFFSPITYHQRF